MKTVTYDESLIWERRECIKSDSCKHWVYIKFLKKMIIFCLPPKIKAFPQTVNTSSSC